MAREEANFDDPIEEVASHWDSTCSTVSLMRWNSDTQKYAVVERFPSPPTFKQVQDAGPGVYRMTIYRLQGKGVKHHVEIEIGGKASQAAPKVATPEPQHTHLSEERIAKIAAEAAVAAVKPILDRVGMMGPPPDPFAAIEKSFKMVGGIFKNVNEFGQQIAEQQSNIAKAAEAAARRRIAAEEADYEDGEYEAEEEELDGVERVMKTAAGYLERKGMKLLSGEAKKPDAVEDEWGITA